MYLHILHRISYDAGFKWEHYDIHTDNCPFADNWPRVNSFKIYGLYTEMSDTALLATYVGMYLKVILIPHFLGYCMDLQNLHLKDI